MRIIFPVALLFGLASSVSADEPVSSEPVSFELQVQPILAARGCSVGACHGKARGQNGFQLSLLGFEVTAGKLDCYVPACSTEKWLARFRFFEAAGDRWWPIAGGVYFLQVVKRMAGLRLITPAWQQRARQKKAFATLARKEPHSPHHPMPEPADSNRAMLP